ncbi:MAG: hypothetical protein ACI85Q_001851 [Salibacteraceae bacterium]|jgi:hypothetical protein
MNKQIFLFLLAVLTTATSFAQTELFRMKVKKEKVPSVVIESISEDFPDATVTEYAAIPVSYIKDQIHY